MSTERLSTGALLVNRFHEFFLVCFLKDLFCRDTYVEIQQIKQHYKLSYVFILSKKFSFMIFSRVLKQLIVKQMIHQHLLNVIVLCYPMEKVHFHVRYDFFHNFYLQKKQS